MTQTISAEHAPPPRAKRRWPRISLRSLLILVTAACLLFGLEIAPALRQQRLVAQLKKVGAQFGYKRLESLWNSDGQQNELFVLLRSWTGEDYWDRLQSVDLTTDSDEILRDNLTALASVDDLTVSDNKAGSQTFKSLRRLPNLKSLSLHSRLFDDAQLDCLTADSRIEKLELWGSWVGDASIASIARCQRLRELGLGDTAITCKKIDWSLLENLRSLDLSGNGLEDDALNGLAALKNLESLDLSENRITGAGLARLGRLPRLRQLDLTQNEIAAPVVSRLTQPGLTLILDNNNIDDDALLNLAKAKNLASLSLMGNPDIDDRGIDNLVASGCQAETLNLSYTAITDTGLRRLADLQTLRKVIVRTTEITADGVAQFKSRRPDLEIEDSTSDPPLNWGGF